MKHAREIQAVKPLVALNRQEDGSYVYAGGEGSPKVSFEEKDVLPVVFVEAQADGTYKYADFFPTEDEWNSLVARVEALENASGG